MKTTEAQGAYRFHPVEIQIYIIPQTVTAALKRSRNVHLLTGCNVAHDGNRKTMKINLRMEQTLEFQTKTVCIW